MIELREITKRYRDETVIDNVSVRIEKGKITSFVGPNGAGKTTLLSIVSRLIPFDSGQVIIDGTELQKWSTNDLAKKISILRQSNFVSVRLTVRDLVGFGRFPYSGGRLTKADEEKIDMALEHLNLANIQFRYLDELSGGQRQRAFIAMVVAQDTEYILLDEPLNNLDMRHASEMMQTLRGLTSELGKTVVVVLHDINFASVYSDRLAALKDGKLVKEGSVQEIIREDVLTEIFEIPFKIEEVDGKRICIYF